METVQNYFFTIATIINKEQFKYKYLMHLIFSLYKQITSYYWSFVDVIGLVNQPIVLSRNESFWRTTIKINYIFVKIAEKNVYYRENRLISL